MKYYIKEWHDHTATLVAEDGYALAVYENKYEAIEACISDCRVEPEFIESYVDYPDNSPLDFESGFTI